MNILRPLSPHLPIYKPQLTSTFPISHRISGAFLATIVLFFYLLCLKIGLICFTYANFYQFLFYSSKLILISVEITALALSYHLYNGVRHLGLAGRWNFKSIIKYFVFWLTVYAALAVIPVPSDLFLGKVKVILILGVRALSFFLRKMGCSGGLALAIGFAVRALLATETAPPFGNAVSPGREPEPDLRLGLDLNKIPAPSPEPGPEPAPPAPLSVEEEEKLLTKREEVKFLLRGLLQIGYHKRARNEKEIKQLFRDIHIDSEVDAAFLEEIRDHLRDLRQPWGPGGTSGQPTKFSNIEIQELLRWISEKRGN